MDKAKLPEEVANALDEAPGKRTLIATFNYQENSVSYPGNEAIERFSLSQQAELEALRKSADELVAWGKAWDATDRDEFIDAISPIIARAAELRAKDGD